VSSAATNISLLATALLLVPCDAAAQTRVRRIEIAVIGSVIRFVDFDLSAVTGEYSGGVPCFLEGVPVRVFVGDRIVALGK
jgi:hypothetical protein